MRNQELRERVKKLADKYDAKQSLDSDESWQLQSLLIISLQHGYLPTFGARGGIAYKWVGGGSAFQAHYNNLKETARKRFERHVQEIEAWLRK